MENNDNVRQLREFLIDHASNEEVLAIALDYFPSAYKDIEASGLMTRQRIRHLVDYCNSKNKLPELASILLNQFPDQYHELNLNFDTPQKPTSKPHDTYQTNPTINNINTVYTSPSQLQLVVNLIIPIVPIAMLGFVHMAFVSFRPDVLPEFMRTPFASFTHFIPCLLYPFLLLPHLFWVIDNVTRKDLNTMDEDSFPSQQIAPSWAKKIIAERYRVGKFTSMEQVKALPISDRAKFNLGKFYRVGWLPFDYVMYAVWGIKKLGDGKSSRRR